MNRKIHYLLMFFAVLCMNSMYGQNKTISGTVTESESGVPLPGVNVVEKGNNNGTSTDFDGNFAEHRNFHLTKCSGDYIFIIDPDEMPKENLIINLKKMIHDSGAELIMVPRINIHPGFTQEWLKKCNFRTNELDWINWPDYICRVFKNTPQIKYGNELHENIIGTDKRVLLNADPSVAVWHIKSVEKQDNRWDVSGNFKVPEGDNLYDTLM